MLQNLRDGVIAPDAHGGIEALGGKMAELLRLNRRRRSGGGLRRLRRMSRRAVPKEAGETLEMVCGASYVGHCSA